MDEEGIQELRGAFLSEVRSYYLARPPSSDRVFEVLNALAGRNRHDPQGHPIDFIRASGGTNIAVISGKQAI
jgi:hypothetical protein